MGIEDDVAAGFAAEGGASAAHFGGDVSVADGGAKEATANSAQKAFEAAVGEDGPDDRIARELSSGGEVVRPYRHDLVAIKQSACLIDHRQPISVAIEGEAGIGLVLAHGEIGRAN